MNKKNEKQKIAEGSVRSYAPLTTVGKFRSIDTNIDVVSFAREPVTDGYTLSLLSMKTTKNKWGSSIILFEMYEQTIEVKDLK